MGKKELLIAFSLVGRYDWIWSLLRSFPLVYFQPLYPRLITGGRKEMNGTKSKFFNEIFLITTPEKRREGMREKSFCSSSFWQNRKLWMPLCSRFLGQERTMKNFVLVGWFTLHKIGAGRRKGEKERSQRCYSSLYIELARERERERAREREKRKI